MAYYSGYRKWRACAGGVLTWVACLRWWRANVGDVLAWVMWVVC